MFNTFRGGVHPPQRKIPTENSSIENLSVPQVCYIPMKQSADAIAIPVVKIGDIVKEGELIGKGMVNGSANVHASVPGKVIDIREGDTVFNRDTVVVIEAEGAFTATGSSSVIKDWKDADRQKLVDAVITAGITDIECTLLRTDAIPVTADTKNNSVLIVNCTESEPYLTADDVYVRSYPSELIEGIKITLKMLGISKGVIAVEEDKKSTVRILRETIKGSGSDITVKTVHSKYPIGAEKQLIYSVLKRVIPAGSSASEAGVYVQNSSVIYSIRDTVLFNKPVIDRCVTVSGSMINRPGNYKVRIGTMISDLIEECGGLKGEPYRIVIGGPMSGIAVNNTDIPVVKSASGILFLSEKETGRGEYNPCVRCGRCVSVCPMGLVPCEIAGAVERERFDIAERLHAGSCIMCSCCSYICPSGRPLSYLVSTAGKCSSGQK